MSEKITISSSVHARNDIIAQQNRTIFKTHGLTVMNMISSPGSGKTSVLEVMAKRYGERLAVITGDIQTTFDADRSLKAGAAAFQIETGGSCHLSADMIHKSLESFDLHGRTMLVIENVGNLVCPSTYDLGEDFKVALLSVTEGDEKPAKYPALFTRAKAVLINKIDLLPYVTFNVERAKTDCKKLNSNVAFFPISCTTGEGFEDWYTWCSRESGTGHHL